MEAEAGMRGAPAPGTLSSAPVGRLAPSPTGLLHLGHARTFLLAWAHTRSRGGRVVLRVEDLDAERATEAFSDELQRALEWLGLDWDGPVERQSAHRERFSAAARRLLAEGLAYPCVCSRGELRLALGAPQAGDPAPLRYPGTCRGRFSTLEEAESRTGRAAGLRFRAPEREVAFVDGLHGAQRLDVSKAVGDFVIGRRDGLAAYQLAVVVDDAAAGVTEVVRGDDLLESTAQQLLLQEALSLPHPLWFHAPLVLDASGRRLAKRDGALALAALRERGADPRRLVQWALESAGHPASERLTAQDALRSFDLRRTALAPSRVTAELVETLCD